MHVALRSGRVTSATESAPRPGATVSIPGTNISAYTDEDGGFRLGTLEYDFHLAAQP